AAAARAGGAGRGGGRDPKSGDDARALRGGGQVLRLRPRLDLAAAASAAPPADRAAGRQRRGAGDGGPPPRSDRRRLPLAPEEQGDLRHLPPLRRAPRLDAHGRALSPPPPPLPARDDPPPPGARPAPPRFP